MPAIVDALLKTIHLLGAIVWLGGMVFAQFFLRPALGLLEPRDRLRLMQAVLARFFAAVWVAAALVVVSGGWMLARAGSAAPWPWWVMAAGGCAMVVVFAYVRLLPYPRLVRSLAAAEMPAAAAALAAVRRAVMVNLWLGVAIVALLRLAPAP
jgi:uncharacterized membrane protein